MLAGLETAAQEEAWDEVTEQLAQFDGPDGFAAPCELLVVSATRPR